MLGINGSEKQQDFIIMMNMGVAIEPRINAYKMLHSTWCHLQNHISKEFSSRLPVTKKEEHAFTFECMLIMWYMVHLWNPCPLSKHAGSCRYKLPSYLRFLISHWHLPQGGWLHYIFSLIGVQQGMKVRRGAVDVQDMGSIKNGCLRPDWGLSAAGKLTRN